MKSTNMANGAQRNCDVGLAWTEIRSITTAGITTHTVQPYSTLRITATAQTVVAIDGINAITILANTALNINVGPGIPGNTVRTVVVTVNGTCAVSIAQDLDTGRTNP